MKSARRFLQTTLVGRWLLVPYRFKIATSYHAKPLLRVFPWLVRSREPTDFSYQPTALNLRYLAEFVHVVTGVAADECAGYVAELSNDDALARHIRDATLASEERHISDADASPGRRYVYYALVRAIKPQVVVEAGVHKGFGTCVLAAALARNGAEGKPGRVYGVDIVPGKGYLFGPPYSEFGEVVIGDILEFLRSTQLEIDFLLHETVNVPSLERETYELAAPKLSTHAIVCGPWESHELLEFARRTDRTCLVFATTPERHWYPGTKVALAFRPATP